MMKPTRERRVSRQREWQITQVQAGNCAICGSTRRLFPQFCDRHQVEKRQCDRLYQRKKRGSKPWRPGGRGRPPKGPKP